MCITFKSHVSHNELIMNTLRYFDFGASRSLLLLIARIAVVILFILFGYPKLLGFDGTVQYMVAPARRCRPWRRLSPSLWKCLPRF